MSASTAERTPDAPREEIERALAFLRAVLRQWQTALFVLLVGLALCVVFLLVRKPTYRSQTVIVYTEAIRIVDPGEAAARPRSTAMRVQEMLGSRRLLDQVVREFDLYPEIRRKLGPADAIEEFKKHITFHAPGGDTFTIAFEGRSPTEARSVTAHLAKLVIAENATLRMDQADNTRAFLVSEKRVADDELHKTERALASFMAEHPRFALDTTPLATGAAIRAASADSAQAHAAANKAGPRVVWVPAHPAAAAKAGDTPRAAPSPAAVDPEIARARRAAREAAVAALASAQTTLAEKRTRYTDAYPDVVAAREAVARARARLALLPAEAPVAVATAVPAPPPPGPEPAPRRRMVVRRDAKGAPVADPPASNAAEADVVSLETTWARLTRDVTEARQRHDQVEAALFKADIAASSASDVRGAQMTVIDPAYLPDRSVPPGPRTIAAAFAGLAAALGLLLAAGRAAYDDRILDRRGLAGLAEVLVEVPRQQRRRRKRG